MYSAGSGCNLMLNSIEHETELWSYIKGYDFLTNGETITSAIRDVLHGVH